MAGRTRTRPTVGTGEGTSVTGPDDAGIPESERTRLDAAVTLLAAVAFVAVAGVPGFIAAAAVVVGRYLLGETDAFALGQVGVASLPSTPETVEIAIVEVGLLGMLLAPAVTSSRTLETVLVALGWILGGGVLAWTVARSVVDLWVAGALLLAATGFAAYGLHRYQLVSLGHVGGIDE